MTPQEFHHKLMMLSCRFPYRITSYYRDPDSNAQVGGHPNSRHMLWLACDVVCADPADDSELMIEAQRQGLKVIDESTHLHIQAP